MNFNDYVVLCGKYTESFIFISIINRLPLLSSHWPNTGASGENKIDITSKLRKGAKMWKTIWLNPSQ